MPRRYARMAHGHSDVPSLDVSSWDCSTGCSRRSLRFMLSVCGTLWDSVSYQAQPEPICKSTMWDNVVTLQRTRVRLQPRLVEEEVHDREAAARGAHETFLRPIGRRAFA